LQLLLSNYKLDLKPETDQLKTLLPYFLPRYPVDRLSKLVDSLRIGHLLVQPGGLDIHLQIDAEPVINRGPEPALSEPEIKQWEERYRSWDAFLTFVIKEVDEGKELAVAQCLGGQVPGSETAARPIDQGPKPSGLKKAAPAKGSQRIETVAWIKTRNPGHFTLQLAAMSSEQAVKEFITKQSQSGSFAYYQKKQKGSPLYIAIYGSFAKRTEAEQATRLLFLLLL